MNAVGSRLKVTTSHHSICIVFLIETAQKNEEKGDAEYKRNEFSNAADFYTKGIEVNCEDVALNAMLYKKRAASHFLMGEFRPLFDFQFSDNKWRGGGLIVSALLIEWSEFEVLARDTALCSWAGHFTFTMLFSSLSTQVYKWVLANLMVTLLWTGIPSRGE